MSTNDFRSLARRYLSSERAARPSRFGAMSNDDLLLVSERIYAIVQRFRRPGVPLTQQEVLDALAKSAHEAFDERVAAILLASIATPEGQLASLSQFYWAQEAFPQITMPHKYAAALLATAVPTDLLDAVRAPWMCFRIDVPDGLIQLDNPRVGPESVRHLWVLRLPHEQYGTAWAYRMVTGSALEFWRFGVPTEELVPKAGDDGGADKDPLLIQVTDLDERAAHLAGVLIINLCLAMTNPDMVRESGPGHQRWRDAKRRDARLPEPAVRSFQVGKPVKHDFRGAVASFLAGESTKLSVQSRVAGHYRAQPFGPKASQRKIIWVEPYWRGPEDAPIAVRPHRVGE